eukprot:scaffold4775_cov60-Phaeocystis_antarctica.AAC.3
MCADTCLEVSAVLVLPQRTTLAAWGGLSRLQAAQCTRDEPWPCGRLTRTRTLTVTRCAARSCGERRGGERRGDGAGRRLLALALGPGHQRAGSS